jgi:hypothetical protein
MKSERSIKRTSVSNLTTGVRDAATKLLIVITTLGVVTGLMVVYNQRLHTFADLGRSEYEGKLVNKSLTIHETNTGSKIELRFLVEGKDGKRFDIAPSPDVYERAQIGMWIKSSKSGVELSWSESRNTPTIESKKE